MPAQNATVKLQFVAVQREHPREAFAAGRVLAGDRHKLTVRRYAGSRKSQLPSRVNFQHTCLPRLIDRDQLQATVAFGNQQPAFCQPGGGHHGRLLFSQPAHKLRSLPFSLPLPQRHGAVGARRGKPAAAGVTALGKLNVIDDAGMGITNLEQCLSKVAA